MKAPAPLYRQALSESWSLLPTSVQALHANTRPTTYAGRGQVQRGCHWIARILAHFLHLPESGNDVSVRVTIAPLPDGERWIRYFDAHRLCSRLRLKEGRIREQLGPVTLYFQLSAADGILSMHLEEVMLGPIPLFRLFRPHVIAREWEQDGCFHMAVETSLPICGPLITYSAMLKRKD